MLNKLKNIFRKNKPVLSEPIGELNIGISTYDVVSSPGWVVDMWFPTHPSNRISKIERILSKI
jgi:hypothetical protein